MSHKGYDWIFAPPRHGWEVLFALVEGPLPELGDPPPAKWNSTAWKGDLALMRLRREEEG